MRIGYDAKRLFFNSSGLGNYSRSTVEMVARLAPETEIVLFSPKHGNTQNFVLPPNVTVHYPARQSIFRGPLSSYWRSLHMGKDIRREKIDLFHGLSHELPGNIANSGAKSIVTMHDLIFVHHPELYSTFDRYLYIKKYRKSCELADRIIAISHQTKNDLIQYWDIDPERIDVVYQGCNPIFYETVRPEEQERIRNKYELPEGKFILSVGTVEPRKNLMLTLQAMVEGKIETPLVVCGHWKPYKNELQAYAEKYKIEHLVYFRNKIDFADLPAIYQMAGVLVYASIFEGFGIPILEAFNSGIPVITSIGGVFPETGGEAAYYIDPHSVDDMRKALEKTLTDETLRAQMIAEGRAYALNFREEAIFPVLWASYQKALGK